MNFKIKLWGYILMILLNASAQWEWTSNLPSEIVSTHEFFLSVKAPVNTGSVRLVSKKLKPRTFETLIKDTGVVEFPDPFSYGNDGSVHGYDNLEVYFEDELVLERQVYIYPSTLSIAGLYDNTGTYVTAAVASSIFYMTVLNNDSTILPNTTLILAPFASNCSSVISAKSTMDILSNSSYIAIHGPDCSESAAVDAVIAGAFEIPMISGTASASKLSNKRAYPYFMRTTPTSTLHAIALLNTVNFFKFKHIIAISTDQFPFSDDFYTLANRLNITIVANIILKTGEMDFSHQLDIISKTGVNVIISNVMDVAGRFDAKVLYEYGIKKGLFNEPYNWFLEFTPMLDFDYYVPKEYSQAVFYSMSSSMYLNMNRTDIAQHITDTWNSFNGDISTIPYVNFDVGPNDIKDFWEKVHNKQIKMRQVHSFQVDCLSTIARALHDILYIKKIPLDGKTLYSAMRNQSFEGLTGKLIFDQNGDTQPPFYINVYNNVFDEYAGEVTWDPVSHIGNLSLKNMAIKFSLNSTDIPTGVSCPANCGNGTCALPLQCICNEGYTRDVTLFQNKQLDCTVPVCQTPCGYGECISPNVCKCQKNYYGQDCSMYSLELQTPGITYQIYNGIIGVTNVVLAVGAVVAFIGLKYSSFTKVKKFGLDLLQFTILGSVIGHAGVVTGMIFPSIATCTLKYILYIIGLTLILSSLFIRSWRVYYIFERPTSVSSSTIITFKKLMMIMLFFVAISTIGLIISILSDIPSTKTMTDIDMEYFYLACTIPTQVGGIMGLIIIALNVIFLLVLFLLVAQLSKSVPADFRESKAFIISYLIFFILVCQTVAEYLKYSETIKTAIFGMLSALLFSVPTFFIVIPKLYLVLSSKSRKSTDPNKSSQSIGTVSTSFASLTLTPIKKLGNEVVMGNFAHLTPGLLGKWTRKVAYYDRKTNLFTLIPMVSLEIEERVLSCFQINGKNSKLVYKPTKKVEDKVGNMNFNNETLKKLEPNKNNVNEKGFAAHSDDESLFKETVEFMIICGGESHRVLLVDEDKEQIKLWKSLAEELSKSSNRAAVNISK